MPIFFGRRIHLFHECVISCFVSWSFSWFFWSSSLFMMLLTVTSASVLITFLVNHVSVLWSLAKIFNKMSLLAELLSPQAIYFSFGFLLRIWTLEVHFRPQQESGSQCCPPEPCARTDLLSRISPSGVTDTHWAVLVSDHAWKTNALVNGVPPLW